MPTHKTCILLEIDETPQVCTCCLDYDDTGVRTESPTHGIRQTRWMVVTFLVFSKGASATTLSVLNENREYYPISMWKIISHFLVVCIYYWTQPSLLNRLFKSLYFATLISFFTISHYKCIWNFINTEYFSFTCLLVYREVYWLHDSRVDNKLKHLLCVYDLKKNLRPIDFFWKRISLVHTFYIFIIHISFVKRKYFIELCLSALLLVFDRMTYEQLLISRWISSKQNRTRLIRFLS